ncbi:MAG: hypothetical protein JSV17_14360 [Candidatus Aminicenantes bacterium]|nr:MAG: hypothetical protein JSV17_14360 [Candidatus Aminicenantes bacterium]
MKHITPTYRFVPYGSQFEPKKDTLILDVGMKTIPGIIDHHHPDAEPECTASLIVKHPSLILNHIDRERIVKETDRLHALQIITHRRPDFDAVTSIFLVLKLLETGKVDPAMEKIAGYTKLVDSASLPKDWDLPTTPYAILRALFLKIRKKNKEAYVARIRTGLRFINFLYFSLKKGYEIAHNRTLFAGIDRYERAIKKAEDDYFDYLCDLERCQILSLELPFASGAGKRRVDGLIVRNPRSYLFKDWARRDMTHTSLKQGFSFLMTNFGNSRYILGVDPEMGVYLKGLGSLLNHKEAEQRKRENRPFAERWYEGNCPLFNFRIIDSPQDISSLSHQEIADTILKFSHL